MRGHDTQGWVVLLVLRDGAECYLCGQGTDPEDPFEVDHVQPKAAHGKTVPRNLRLTHRSCNQAKHVAAVVV